MNAKSIDKALRVLFILLFVTGLVWIPTSSTAAAGNNQIVGWGYNYFGQAAAPVDLSDVIAIAAGSYHNLAINRDGTVIAWGDDDYGNLSIPVGLSGVIAADVSFHNLVLKNDGTVVAWGYNSGGQTNVPAGLADVVAVAAGSIHSLALKSDGTVVAWGFGGFGQSDIPAGLTDVIAIDEGAKHSIALRNDGTVVAWGNNDHGQSNVPAGLSDVKAVAAGDYHNLALKSDGTVVAWGINFSGQTNVPLGLNGVIMVSAGADHSLALKSDGTVVAWGGGSSGQATVPAGLAGVISISAGKSHSLALVAPVPAFNPLIFVEPNEDNVYALNWTDGTILTVTIDDPATIGIMDYTGTMTAVAAQDWDHGLKLGDIFDIKPGYIVTLSGEGITKQHTVTHLTVMNVDIDADTVSGIAYPGSRLHVGTLCDENGCAHRNVTVDQDGTWLADFSNPVSDPNDGSGLFDIRLGDGNSVYEGDEDGDNTKVDWYLPNPRFSVIFPKKEIHGYEWPMGANITLTIDDPSNGTGVDYSRTKTVGAENFRPPFGTWIGFSGDFTLKPGDIVTMTDGTTTKTHIMQEIEVTNVDPVADTVSGTAAPGTDVGVNGGCGNNGCAYRNVHVDTSGHWLADFSVPGDENNEDAIFDIRLGSSGHAERTDDDGDGTVYDWSLGDPRIFALLGEQRVHAWGWLAGTPLTLTIDNPATTQSPDYTGTQEATAIEDWDYGADWGIAYDIQPGYLVTVSGGGVTKELTVAHLSVTAVDIEADTVSGTGDPGYEIHVGRLCDDYSCTRRNIYVDANGNWFADFSVPGHDDDETVFDIRPGSGTGVYEIDEDNDATNVGWNVPNPRFETNLTQNFIHGFDWVPGTSVTLTIDEASNGTGIDYTETLPVRTDNPWGSEPWVEFEPPFQMEPGDTVTLTDGSNVKIHVATQIRVTSINVGTDTVSGIANPFARVAIWTDTPDCCVDRVVFANSNGEWLVDFSIPGDEDWESQTVDLQPGSGGQAAENDDDADTTNIRWQSPNPSITVYPDDDVIEGNEWPLDATLTVQIGDPEQPDYVTTTSLNPADQDHILPWFKLDLTGTYNLQPGELVTVFDAATTKQVIAVGRNITSIDSLTDIITGLAGPTIKSVVLWTCDGDDCAVRRKDVNPDGSWSVNFAVPGELDWENGIVDITPDTNGGIWQCDEDGDGTNYLEWRVLNQPPEANAGPDQTVYVLDPVMLDASASSDPDGDPLFYEWDLNNDGQYHDASGVTSATTFTQPGIYIIGLRVTDAGGLSSTDMVTITVLPWELRGFYQPVDINGVYNIVKGGSTVPLKFEIFTGPTELTDTTDIESLTYTQISCDANAITDAVEILVTGTTLLRYDTASGQFIYNWKTPKMPGKCFRITVTTIENSALVAYFKLK